MREHLLVITGTWAVMLGVSCVSAQTAGDAGSTNLNRLGLSYRMGFNISAKFKNAGGYAGLVNPRQTPNGAPFNYDNGYIYGDATPNVHPGLTWYYGYDARVSTTDLELSRSSSPANSTLAGVDGDPQHGLEMTYNRQLGAVGRGFWGLEAALGFADLTIRDNRSAHGTVVRITDTFSTPAEALNPAPFYGRFEGPVDLPSGAPLVGLPRVDTETTTVLGGTTVVGHRQFDAQVVSLRFGPYVDIPMGGQWTFSLSAGLALWAVSSDFKFDETVSIDPAVSYVELPSERHQGAGSDNDVVVGGYVSGKFSYAVNDCVSVFAGAQFQYAGDYSHREAGKAAELDLGQSVFAMVGLDFSF